MILPANKSRGLEVRLCDCLVCFGAQVFLARKGEKRVERHRKRGRGEMKGRKDERKKEWRRKGKRK